MSGPVELQAPVGTVLPPEVVGYVVAAVITCLVWEALINLSFDVEYALRRPHTVVKVAYFISRSMGLGSQFANVRQLAGARWAPPSYHLCRLELGFQFMVLGLIMTSLYTLLLARLWALWDRNKPFGWLLICFTAGKSVAIAVILHFVAEDAIIGHRCTVDRMPRIVIAICVIEVVSHLLLFSLTVLKCYQKSGALGHVVPLLDMLIRDGWLILVVSIGFCAGTIATLVAFGKPTRVFPPLAIAATSITTCRIIKNHRQFRQEEPPFPSTFVTPDMTVISV